MKHVRNPMIFYSGILLVMVSVFLGVFVGLQNLSLWWMTFCLGVSNTLNSFVLSEKKPDEREQLIRYRSLQVAFFGITLIGMFLYTLLYFRLWIIPGYDAIILMMGLLFIMQAGGAFVYSRKI